MTLTDTRHITSSDLGTAAAGVRPEPLQRHSAAPTTATPTDGPLTRTPSRPLGSFQGVVFIEGPHRPGMFGFLAPQ